MPKIVFRRRPFILRPERKGLQNWLEVLKKLGETRGDPLWVNYFVPSMVEKGKEVGINFEFDTKVGNSMDSLRLLEWCWDSHPSFQNKLAHRLAVGHFEEKRTVGSHDSLLIACDEVGLDLNECKAILNSNAYQESVEKLIEEAHQDGFFSIPIFSFFQNGKLKFRTQGARSVEDYESILNQLCP